MREHEQELLRQRVEQDQRFHSNNLQKEQKKIREAKEVEKFLKAQMVSAVHTDLHGKLMYLIG